MTLYGQQTQQAWEKTILYSQLTVPFRRGAFYLDIPGGQILLGIGLSAKHIGFTVFEGVGGADIIIHVSWGFLLFFL